ncbi:hypothetical protein AM500_18005 [Bacillus sp. FJAT-18017]|uniref:hypothetical protein n=1 Tax=Bacillus sp. FJAT-18017 TaxID=1705566 RepID=UPI0006AD9A88|nr:hypothetical protein [Bacillus sp. FJAT-18017]ALC91471.1 hypothetical protein AM500_18005 [Bacillus sp. FJAT-18017]
MPIQLSKMQNPDTAILTVDELNEAIFKHLGTRNFIINKGRTSSDPDIRAVKFDVELIIESRGNQASKNKGNDIVFDSSQLDIHLSEHVIQMMKFQQSVSSANQLVFIMVMPDIVRLRERVKKIDKGLDTLNIVRVWVDNLENIRCEGNIEAKLIVEELFK